MKQVHSPCKRFLLRARPLGHCALMFALAVQGMSAAQVPTTDANLQKGIRQVEEGDLEAAVFTLDASVRSLSAEKGRANELAVAHLYLAMAHMGLSRIEAAKAEVMAAWRSNQGLTLDPKKFPPTLVRMFEEAKRTSAAAPPPAPKKKSSKAPLYIGLGLASVGGGVAVAAKGRGGGAQATSAPPSVAIDRSPTGGVIAGVTAVTFTAIATQLTSPTFTWNFGDGGSGTGASVQHRFDTEGTFGVVVTATGTEGSTTSTVSVLSRSLTGKWADFRGCPPPPSPTDFCNVVELNQKGAVLTGTYGDYAGRDTRGEDSFGLISGTVAPPNQVIFTQSNHCVRTYTMTLSSDLNTMSGQVTSPVFACSPGGLPFNTTFGRQ